jgi:hypothetical protein
VCSQLNERAPLKLGAIVTHWLYYLTHLTGLACPRCDHPRWLRRWRVAFWIPIVCMIWLMEDDNAICPDLGWSVTASISSKRNSDESIEVIYNPL